MDGATLAHMIQPKGIFSNAIQSCNFKISTERSYMVLIPAYELEILCMAMASKVS